MYYYFIIVADLLLLFLFFLFGPVSAMISLLGDRNIIKSFNSNRKRLYYDIATILPLITAVHCVGMNCVTAIYPLRLHIDLICFLLVLSLYSHSDNHVIIAQIIVTVTLLYSGIVITVIHPYKITEGADWTAFAVFITLQVFILCLFCIWYHFRCQVKTTSFLWIEVEKCIEEIKIEQRNYLWLLPFDVFCDISTLKIELEKADKNGKLFELLNTNKQRLEVSGSLLDLLNRLMLREKK